MPKAFSMANRGSRPNATALSKIRRHPRVKIFPSGNCWVNSGMTPFIIAVIFRDDSLFPGMGPIQSDTMP